jgi:hypothetical protein
MKARENYILENESEGYVIRRADAFLRSEFNRSVAKYVRANHVKNEGHWLTKQVIPNELHKV